MADLPIRRFDNPRIAVDYSLEGGVALHVWKPPQTADGKSYWPNAPAPFIRSKFWAHMLCQNKHRLVNLAKRFGVRQIVVSREGQREQHVDLCGAPLKKALAMAGVTARTEDQGMLFEEE